MKFADLVPILRRDQGNGFWYLASPYSKFPDLDGRSGTYESLEMAAQEIARVHMALLEEGVNTFCPIVHTHWTSRYQSARTKNDHEFWVKKVDGPFIRASVGMIICKMPTWNISTGIDLETKDFAQACKAIHELDWPVEA